MDQKSGNVYVSDYEAQHVVKLTAGGSYVSTIGSVGSGEGQVKGPEALTVSSAGNLYVGDSGNHRVDEFSASGKYLGSFGKVGTGEGQFKATIGGLAADSSGNIWASDSAATNGLRSSALRVNTFAGFGKEGTGEGQFKEPLGLAVVGGTLYVADRNNNRIQEFTLEGKYLGSFGSYGEENGRLEGPWANHGRPERRPVRQRLRP